MAARRIGTCRERLAVPLLRFFEEAHGPERVAVQGQGFRIAGGRLQKRIRLGAREIELGNAKCRHDDARPRRPRVGRLGRLDRLLIRLQRLKIATFDEELLADLKLDFSHLRLRGDAGVNRERSRDDEGG